MESKNSENILKNNDFFKIPQKKSDFGKWKHLKKIKLNVWIKIPRSTVYKIKKENDELNHLIFQKGEKKYLFRYDSQLLYNDYLKIHYKKDFHNIVKFR